MRILFLCGDRGIPVGGVKGAAAHVRGLVRALVDLGHEVVVVAASPEGEEPLAAPVVAAPGPLPELPSLVPPPLGRALAHLLQNGAVERALDAVAERFPADLLYERLAPFGIAGSLFAERRGLPHVLEVNAPLAWEGKAFRRQALSEGAEALEQAALGRASMVVAVSDEIRDLVITGGVPAERVHVVPNGVDLHRFSPQGAVHENGLRGAFVVGFVGGLRPWHGIDDLTRAFATLAEDPRYHLLVVGTGPESRKITALAERFPGRVTAVGAVAQSKVPAYLRAMDVAVAPYPALDPFYYSPLKVLEYMASGRAVVASGIGQVGRLIHSGVDGLLVPPGDPGALAAAIRDLAGDPARREALGRAAAEAAREHAWSSRAATILDRAPRERPC